MSSVKESSYRYHETAYVPPLIELYEDPTNPEEITAFWQQFVDNSVAQANMRERLRIEERREEEELKPENKRVVIKDWVDLQVPVVLPCMYTTDELKSLAEDNRAPVYNLGISYGKLGVLVDKTDYNSRGRKELGKEVDHQEEAGWSDIELLFNSPSRSVSPEDNRELKVIRFGTYLLAAHAIHSVTGEFPDTRTSSLVDVAGTIGAASFHPEGRVGVIRRFPQHVQFHNLGIRTEGFKSTE